MLSEEKSNDKIVMNAIAHHSCKSKEKNNYIGLYTHATFLERLKKADNNLSLLWGNGNPKELSSRHGFWCLHPEIKILIFQKAFNFLGNKLAWMNKELEFFDYFYITIPVFLHFGQYARLTKCTFINQRNKHTRKNRVFFQEKILFGISIKRKVITFLNWNIGLLGKM